MTWFCNESCILMLYYFAMCVMNVIYKWLLSAGLAVPLQAVWTSRCQTTARKEDTPDCLSRSIVWTSWCGLQSVKKIPLTVCPDPLYGRLVWTAVRQEDFPECSGGLAVPATDNCGLRQDSKADAHQCWAESTVARNSARCTCLATHSRPPSHSVNPPVVVVM